MEQLAHHLGDELRRKRANVRTQMWASGAERTPDGRWDVKWDLWSMGVVDYLVVAHSGKCARRLTSARGLQRCQRVVDQVRLGVVWSVVAVFQETLGLSFDAAMVEGSQEVAWAGCQTSKLGAPGDGGDSVECWVIHSTNAYGWKHKVPQEFVPPEYQQAVADELLAAFSSLVAPLRPSDSGLPPTLALRAQLWGAGLPRAGLQGADFVFDPLVKAGVCADWCVAPCIEGAVLSGLQLADAVAAHSARIPQAACTFYPPDDALGLAPFRHKCEIAAFPGWLDEPSVLRCDFGGAAGPAPGRQLLAPVAPAAAPAAPLAVRRSRWGRGDATERQAGEGEGARRDGELRKLDGVGDTNQPTEDSAALLAPVPEATLAHSKRWQSKRRDEGSGLQAAKTLGSTCGTEGPETLLQEPSRAVELYPGLVLLEGALGPEAQQRVADEVFKLGGHADELAGRQLRSGGFYRAASGGLRELNVAQERRGSFVRPLQDCDPLLAELCAACFRAAAALSAALPPLDARACAFNYYAEDSPGLRWHRDIDETSEHLQEGTGRPVVSVSLGDACDFEFRPPRAARAAMATDVPSERLRLRSGDVLVFGGPSRGIYHAVTRIYPKMRPAFIRMPPGRLNLTYRHHV